VLTETVLEAVRTRPQGESYTLADGRVPGLALEVAPPAHATWWLWYRTTSGQRRQPQSSERWAPSRWNWRASSPWRPSSPSARRGPRPGAQRSAQRCANGRGYLVDVYARKVLQHAKGGVRTKARILAAWKPCSGPRSPSFTRDAIEEGPRDPEGGRESRWNVDQGLGRVPGHARRRRRRGAPGRDPDGAPTRAHPQAAG